MKLITDSKKYILRFDGGEDVVAELISFCGKENILAATFTGLGACGKVVLSYYDLTNKNTLIKHLRKS